MKGLKATAEKRGGNTPSYRSTTSLGQTVRGQGNGRKESGITKEAARGLGVKRK